MSKGLEARDNTGKKSPLLSSGQDPSGSNATEAGGVSTSPGMVGTPPVTVLKVDPVYVVLRDFRCVINGCLTEYRRGDLVTDPTVVKALLDGKSPIIPETDNTRYVTCPACKHQFPILED